MAKSISNAPLPDILRDWDGEELMEGVRIAAKALQVTSLRDWLELTTAVEAYQRHLRAQRELK